MANDITVTKNTTSGSERWDVEYTADASGTVTKTMDTAETIMDRDIKVTVTIPSGSATTPATTITSNPTISVNSSTGVITASNSKTQSVTPTVSAGYVTGGTSGTITVSGSNTSNLTTQAAQTIYPSTSDQTISSGKYLTGTQTIKAVTTTNLSAGNIKSGVTVKVGDSADDDRVASVTGSYSGIDVSDTTAAASDVRTGKYFYTAAGTKTQGSLANGSATTPATTVTANPSISVNSSTGVITASVSTTKSVTPTVSAGYVSSGTAGTITVSGSKTSNLTTRAAQTIYPSTSDQTITSGRYLTGTQTIKGVLLTNLSAGNIKKDVVVKVGDSADDDRITAVTGTYEGSGGGSSATVTDLTNTVWLMNAVPNAATLPTTGYNVLFQIGGLESSYGVRFDEYMLPPRRVFTNLCKYTFGVSGLSVCGDNMYFDVSSSTQKWSVYSSRNGIYTANDGWWGDNLNRLWMFFSGGGASTTDHTNTTLINWMKANATLILPLG